MRSRTLTVIGLLLVSGLLAGCSARLLLEKAVSLTAPGDKPGGTQVVLETDLAPGRCLVAQDLAAAVLVIRQRLAALGTSGVRVTTQDQGCAGRITVEFASVADPDLVVQTATSPGRLELVEIGPDYPEVAPGVYLRTTGSLDGGLRAVEAIGQAELPYPDTVFQTIMTGAGIADATARIGDAGRAYVFFELTEDASSVFADYTAAHVGGILAIVLDNITLSAPMIQGPIPDGQGVIEGQFTLPEAQAIAAKMRSGALPTPLKVISRRVIGGAD